MERTRNGVPAGMHPRPWSELDENAVEFPRDRLVHELFEAQAALTPDAIAVVWAEESLTYAELERRANQLAHHLSDAGLTEGQYVAIVMTRCPLLLIAELAVLKNGAAYVPVDPATPEKRRNLITRNCDARFVLAAEPSRGEEVARWINCATVDTVISSSSLAKPRPHIDARAPAYMMYTSGSTGEPKGVTVSHLSINNLIVAGGYADTIDSSDCIAHCSNPSFDASTFEIWGALLKGARLLIVPPAAVLQTQELGALLQRNGATVLFLTTALFNHHARTSPQIFGSLRYALFGGETADVAAVARVRGAAPDLQLVNVYGPTETTTFATAYAVPSTVGMGASLSIGRPIANTRIHILDEEGRPVALGATGEICVGGAGVALGYHGLPVLTQKKFVRDHFSTDPRARLYRTGDLGRWRADRNLEFLGRIDEQIKIRGYRIEPGEIETQLVRYPAVREAVVVAREDVPGDKRLVAYLTLSHSNAPPAQDLIDHLRTMLPDYMIPAAFVVLQSLPLTPSGKIDRHGLPAPASEAYAAAAYAAPEGEIEKAVASIWQQVLRLERVGRLDNFFTLGGNSLLVVRVLDHLRRAGLSVELPRLFDSRTLSDLAAAITHGGAKELPVRPHLIPTGCQKITPEMLPLAKLEQAHIDLIAGAVPGGAPNIQDIYPLAPLQEGMLFHYLMNAEGDVYVLARLLSFPSTQRLEQFLEALQHVLDRHDALRTAVLWRQLPTPVQVVYRHVRLTVERPALNRDTEPVEQFAERMQPQLQRINLELAPLLRVQVTDDPRGGRCYALLQLHHIVCDNESLTVLLSEVRAFMEGEGRRLPEAVPYRRHVAQSLAQTQGGKAEAFFRAKLADVDEPTLPFGLADVRGNGGRVDEGRAVIDSSLGAIVRSQAKRLGVTPAMLFHAAWALVVAHTSARDDVVFGTVLLGRLHGEAGAQHIVGMFINTLPLRLCLKELTAVTLVERTQEELIELLGHEQASLTLAQRCSGLPGGAPLFSAVLNYRHGPQSVLPESDPALGMSVLASNTASNYPILISIDDLGETFRLTANTDRVIAPERILGYLRTALMSLVTALEDDPRAPALELSILPPAERKELLESFSVTRALPPHTELIHRLFEEQVRINPKAMAVVFQHQSLTYEELNRRSNQLARHLKSLGVIPGQRVGICLDRGIDMVVAVLGVLKAGAAYVPLDPDYPPERLAFMVLDAAPEVILTHGALEERLPTRAHILKVRLDADFSAIANNDGTDLDVHAMRGSGEDLAYVIYTSGSTGMPKGVMVTHRNLVSSTVARHLYYGDPGRFLLLSPLSFDSSVAGIFGTLTGGGTLVVASRTVSRDPAELLTKIRDHQITSLLCVPSLYQRLLAVDSTALRTYRLSRVIVAGEACPPALISESRACAPAVTVFNEYGPTEATVWATVFECNPRQLTRSVAIGRPIAGARVYVLDARKMPVPVGVTGEIYIGGSGVALGYLNRPDLTRERFIPNPFDDARSDFLYRTGDLGRWHVDGTLEFLGRNDQQVKLRGYRIELGELEGQLGRHGRVKEAVAELREDDPGDRRLVAYVTLKPLKPGAEAQQERAVSGEDLRQYLKKRLPEYMVPSAVIVLGELPLTPNGKLDRRALPKPDRRSSSRSSDEALRGEVEEALAAIWKEVLRQESVLRHDSFFDLGGHSLLAMQVAVRVQQCLGVEIAVNVIFERPTLIDLAAHIGDRREDLLAELDVKEEHLSGLLERVARMSECEAQELTKQLRAGGAR